MANYSQNVKPRLAFDDAIIAVFRKYAVFKGRSRRSEYWWWMLGLLLVGAVLNIAQIIIIAISYNAGFPLAYIDSPIYIFIFLLAVILGLVSLIPYFAVTVRRLHDVNKSGWNILWGAIPIVGAIIVLVWLCQDSDVNTNKYGESPKYNYSASNTLYTYNTPANKEASSFSALIWVLALVIIGLLAFIFFMLTESGNQASEISQVYDNTGIYTPSENSNAIDSLPVETTEEMDDEFAFDPWSGRYVLTGAQYRNFDTVCHLQIERSDRNNYVGEIEMFFGNKDEEGKIEAINASLTGVIRGKCEGNILTIVLDDYTADDPNGYIAHGNLKSGKQIFRIYYNNSNYSFEPVGNIGSYFEGMTENTIDKIF